MQKTIVFIICLWASLGFAHPVQREMAKVARKRIAGGGGGGSPYVFQEDFEGTGLAGWTAGGSGNPDGGGLDGAQGYVTNGTATSYHTSPAFTSVDSFWCYFMVRGFSAASASTRYCMHFLAGGVVQARFRLGNTWNPGAQHGTPSAASGSAMAIDTTYHVWLEYIPQTIAGADGIARVYFSTTGIRPAAALTMTTGTGTGGITQVTIGTQSTGSGSRYIDKVRISASAIGDNPT